MATAMDRAQWPIARGAVACAWPPEPDLREMLAWLDDYGRRPHAYAHLRRPERPLPEALVRWLPDLIRAAKPAQTELLRRCLGQILLLPQAEAYRHLGLHRTATPEQIRRHYYALMGVFHPDRGANTTQATLINQAYAQLKDQERRALYDRDLPPLRYPPPTWAWVRQEAARWADVAALSANPTGATGRWRLPLGFGIATCAVLAVVIAQGGRMQGDQMDGQTVGPLLAASSVPAEDPPPPPSPPVLAVVSPAISHPILPVPEETTQLAPQTESPPPASAVPASPPPSPRAQAQGRVPAVRHPAPTRALPDTQTVAKQALATLKRAYEARSAAAVGALLTPRAITQEARGRSRIQELHAQLFAAVESLKLDWQESRIQAATAERISGRTIYQIQVKARGQRPRRQQGTLEWTLERQPDGRWQFSRLWSHGS